jgi:hypothetical protein
LLADWRQRRALGSYGTELSQHSPESNHAQCWSGFGALTILDYLDVVSLIARREADLENLKQDQAYVGLVLRHGDSQGHFQQMEKHIVFLKKQIQQGIQLEQNRLRLTWATRNLAVHLQSYGPIDKSTAMLHEALELRRQMTSQYPSVTRYRVDLATQLHFLGHLYLDNFQDDQANEVFQESYQWAQKILASNPNNPMIEVLYPELLWHRVSNLSLQGDWQAARDSIETYWDAQYGSSQTSSRQAKDPASILRLWEYCCLRTGDTSTIEKVRQLRTQFPQDRDQTPSDDTSTIAQIQRLVQSAEASLLAADKALFDQQSQEAYELEQASLNRMQELLGLIRAESQEWKQQPGRWKEIWDLTLRNPSFTTARASTELQRWPPADRQAWESIWQEIRALID